MKLIDKDKVVAEIKKRYENWREKEFNSHNIESEIRMSECQHFMLLFNSIKTKEVDLEKEIDEIWNPRFNLGWDEKSLLSMNHEGFTTIAKYFFELGIAVSNKQIKEKDI